MKAQDLIGNWVHSHEEDAGNEMVFRPSDHTFPRSRGRDSFELQANAAIVRGPGPGDATAETRGTWSLSASGDILISAGSGLKLARVLKVVSVEPDRLVVRKD